MGSDARIGYIVGEALDHVHAALEEKKILEVKLAWAKYLVSWIHIHSGPGFMLELIFQSAARGIVMSGGVQALGRTKSLSVLLFHYIKYSSTITIVVTSLLCTLHKWASEASPTPGCSIEISLDIYMYIVCLRLSIWEN